MEAVVAHCVSYSKLCKPPLMSSTTAASTSVSPSFSQRRGSSVFAQDSSLANFKPCIIRINNQYLSQRKAFGVVLASQSESGSASPAIAQGWILEPVGDGDWRHIGYKVARPGAYEIFSSEMTIGRVADKADIVIPVATVSGLHARVENKEGSLFITDLDSTNGTFINEKRVLPGTTALVPPGSLLTFGDTNLAIFRVSRFRKVIQAKQEPKPEEKVESEAKQGDPQAQTTS